MGTTTYYEADHYPPNDDGMADESKQPTGLELIITTAYGSHQIFLRVEGFEENRKDLHFTKEQAREFGNALVDLAESIQYDNTVPPVED